MNIRLFIRLLISQLIINIVVLSSILGFIWYLKGNDFIVQFLESKIFGMQIYSVLIAIVFAIAFVFSGYLALVLHAPYENIRAKINWLLLEKYHHQIFKEVETNRSWYNNSQVLANDLNHIRDKMLQLSTDLQEFAAAPTFVGSETKEEIIERERQRIARELHDSVSQQLFAATMLLSSINSTIEENVSDATVKQLLTIDKVINAAQTEMRALLLHLRPIGLDDKSLKQGITQILQELQTKVPIEISWDLSDTNLETGNEDHLFRIVQEAVSNTLRHAKATKLEVYLRQNPHALQLKVIDNGVGFNINQSEKMGSYGLINMKERIASMGGTLKIISLPDRGTVIDITVPTK